jgi:hypothetical protein
LRQGRALEARLARIRPAQGRARAATIASRAAGFVLIWRASIDGLVRARFAPNAAKALGPPTKLRHHDYKA